MSSRGRIIVVDHGLHLSIERYRAASYSRELSGKVWKGCAKIAESGFWAGGSPPYGTRRLLLDEKRNPVRLLEHGEHKAIHNQRVKLTAGNNQEVETVQRIFMAFGQDSKEPEDIAVMLNSDGIPSPGGGSWSESSVWAILKSAIYAGNMVWNKTSQRMQSASHPNPKSEWILTEDAFEPIVRKELFFLVQGIITGRQQERLRRYSKEDMLAKLKTMFERFGIIKSNLIGCSTDMVSPATYAHKFQSIDLAYQAIFSEVINNKKKQIIETLEQSDGDLEHVDDFVVIDNLFSINIQPTVPLPYGYDACWIFHPDQRKDVDLTIGVPLSSHKNFDVLGYLAFPRMLFKNRVRIHSRKDDQLDLYGFPLMPLITELRK